MKDCVLFLHGRYLAKHIDYYKKLCRSRYTIAVDGGYNFFKKTGIVPDLLIGDFDSLKGIPRTISANTQILSFPTAKDKSDLELALEYCTREGTRGIDIVQPSVGEPDQFIGNFMLLTLIPHIQKSGYVPRVRIANVAYDIYLLDNGSRLISNGAGDTVSVIPLSKKVKYTCWGTEYAVEDVTVKQGETRALRNRIKAKRAFFEVTGQALLVHQFSKKRT